MEAAQEIAATDDSLADFESWIEEAQRGNTQALGQALAACRDYLMLVASSRLRPALEAKGSPSDLVQETFLRAQRRIDGFRGRTAGEWRLWLRSILLRNLSKQHRRFAATAKRQIDRETTIGDPSSLERLATNDTASRMLVRRERETALFAALDRLPRHYREVVIWHHRERLSFGEIGERRQISQDAARKLWKRALVRLRQELGPDHDWR